MLNVNINKGLFLNVVLSGLLVGLGYKYCIESKATTAGFDVVAIIINKYKNNFPVGSLIRYISIVIMVLGVYQFGWLSVVLGICMTFIQTQVLNKLLDHKVE